MLLGFCEILQDGRKTLALSLKLVTHGERERGFVDATWIVRGFRESLGLKPEAPAKHKRLLLAVVVIECVKITSLCPAAYSLLDLSRTFGACDYCEYALSLECYVDCVKF